jgi:hypothetical protein
MTKTILFVIFVIGIYLVLVILLFTYCFDCLNDLEIAGTATKIPGDSISNLFFRWFWILIEEGFGRKYHPGCTETALDGPIFDEGLLNGMEIALSIAQTLNRRDGPSLYLQCREDAGVDRLSI